MQISTLYVAQVVPAATDQTKAAVQTAQPEQAPSDISVARSSGHPPGA